jgi:hypothetical protein
MKDKEFSHLMFRAWLRDGDILVEGEALMLACLLHAKGKGRQTADMKDVQRIMKDGNLRPIDRTE